MSSAFQTAVKTNVGADQRRNAIDRLVQENDALNLAVLVQTDGLRGEFRRYALNGLGNCNNSNPQLEELAEDTTVDPSLRRRAAELA